MRNYKQELENAIYQLRTKAEDEYYRNTPVDMRGLGVGLQNAYRRYGLDYTGQNLYKEDERVFSESEGKQYLMDEYPEYFNEDSWSDE